MKRMVLSMTVIFLVLCFGSVVWGENIVSVTGKSEQSDHVPTPTLEMAIKAGLTKAVEEVVGSMVAPQDIKKKQELLSQEFFQKADAFILSYTIADKTMLPTGYQASLDVVVDTKGIEKRLAALGILQERDEGSRLREVRLAISGVGSYQSYLMIERLLGEDAEIQDFSLAEMGPTLFIWKVMMRGETGRLATKFLAADFDGRKARVATSERERLDLVLSR
jgi:hypothetical protein